jgi:hypothetical protein
MFTHSLFEPLFSRIYLERDISEGIKANRRCLATPGLELDWGAR